MKKAVLAALSFAAMTTGAFAQTEVKKDYVEANGLKMYYEMHGTGEPLVLLHGAFFNTDMWGGFLPELTKHRQVIMFDMQAHGRTGDIDRPISYESMVEDVAAAMKKLQISNADVFGYSMGGTIATGLASRHPELVRSLATFGSTLSPLNVCYVEEMYQAIFAVTPENFDFPEVKDPYMAIAPNPDDWPKLITKTISMFKTTKGYTTTELNAVTAPTLLMVGDSEGLKLDVVLGWHNAIPNSNLAILPAADHLILLMEPDQILQPYIRFLNSQEEPA